VGGCSVLLAGVDDVRRPSVTRWKQNSPALGDIQQPLRGREIRVLSGHRRLPCGTCLVDRGVGAGAGVARRSPDPRRRGRQWTRSRLRPTTSPRWCSRENNTPSFGSPAQPSRTGKWGCPRHHTTGREPVAVPAVVMAHLHRHGDWWVTGWPSGAERRGPLTQPTASRPISGPIQHGTAQLDSTATTRPSPRRTRPLVKGTGSSGLDRQHPPGAEIELSPEP
jgi:hypothetical protein